MMILKLGSSIIYPVVYRRDFLLDQPKDMYFQCAFVLFFSFVWREKETLFFLSRH